MLKAVTLLSMLVAAPAFASADAAGLKSEGSASSLTSRPAGRSAAVAEAAAWRTLIGGLMRSSAQVLASPEHSMAALATPDLGGEITTALRDR